MSSKFKRFKHKSDILSAFHRSIPSRRQSKSAGKRQEGRAMVNLERDFNRPKY